MPYGLRIRSASLSLGTACDFFVPDEDMPNEPNKRGYQVFRDDIDTSSGNLFVYDKGKRKNWRLEFEAVSTRTKEFMEHFDSGWLGQQQVAVIFFGTNVTGTTQSCGTYEASQIWGTGVLRLTEIPAESMFDAWDFSVEIKQFGSSQSF